MLPAFRANGFDNIQIGKEAFFDLKQFSLAGGSMELVRAATNKARREGVVVSEYDPFAPEAESTNTELLDISAEWLREKGNREMGFLLGGLGLNRRSEKRYFIARSGNGKGRIEGFLICEPIYARRGYYLDVTRRRADAVRGTMELLTSEIFKLLAAEGYEVASMGLAPLAGLDDPNLSNHRRLANLMRFLYEHVDKTYDFKKLHRYKAKYHPQSWERRYLCFRPRVGPRILYATLHVRDAFSLREIFSRNSELIGSNSRLGLWAAGTSFKSWKHSASFVIGLFYAILSWS
jgi:phosphatidylglycerol lysyltransferase